MIETPPQLAGVPVLGNTVGHIRDPLSLVERGREEVGDVFRVRVVGIGDITYCTHPDYAKRILKTDQESFSKADNYTIPAFSQGLHNVGGDQWRRQRDQISEFFYPERIRSYGADMVSITSDRLEKLSDGDRIDLLKQMKAVALENILGTLFRQRPDSERIDELLQASHDLHLWTSLLTHLVPSSTVNPYRRRFERAAETIDAEGERLFRERREDELGSDLLSALLRAKRNGVALEDEEIVDQVGSFVFAGHDSTALTLTFALYELDRNPAVRDRFEAELESVLDGRGPGPDDVSQLPVTTRILRETMRLYPPIYNVPRVTTRLVDLDEYLIPGDSRVWISSYSIHRDKRFYDDPNEFLPSRWQELDPGSLGYAYLPFSRGPRACIARQFALLEATLVLAVIGQRFRVKAPESVVLDPGMTLQPAGSVRATIRTR